MRGRSLGLATALAASLGVGAGAQEPMPALIDRPTPGTSATAATGQISFVANVPYSSGSDLEFGTFTVSVGGAPQQRDYAFAGRLRNPVQVIDITNPAAPAKVADVRCSLSQNDVQLTRIPDGRRILVMAADSTGSCVLPNGTTLANVRGFATADVTDPRSPQVLGKADQSQGAHNVTVHPTQPLVYISNSDLTPTPAVIHIWDISNPAAPVKVKDWTYPAPVPPHDITFNAAGTRAYAASITHTDIIDTTDARNPRLLATIVDPTITIHHQADPSPDGSLLYITDELGGGGAPVPCPGGGVHVYSILADAPVKVGAFWADETASVSVCTSHVFRINPDGNSMAIAWYNAGVYVFDISSLARIGLAGAGNALPPGVGVRTIGSMKLPNADTWSAKMWQERHPGYVFANDIRRGFDVFYVPPLA